MSKKVKAEKMKANEEDTEEERRCKYIFNGL